jgi:hypothetical protein
MTIVTGSNPPSYVGSMVREHLRHLDGIATGTRNLATRLGEVGKRGLLVSKGSKEFVGGRGAERCQGLLHRCAVLRPMRSASLPRSGNLFAERVGLIGQ